MKIYLVGGAVRDAVLGLLIKERDYVVIGATPEEMSTQGYIPVGRDFPVFLHPKTHEEYALARTERKTSRGHQGFSFYTDPKVTLEEDLKRRDLTINAMALNEETGQIIDPYHGQADLQARILRHVSEAFSEDPLRILRVARFRAYLGQFNFSIAPETQALMKAMIQENALDELSDERIWKELVRALETDHPQKFFETLEDVCALPNLWKGKLNFHFPENSTPLIRFALLGYQAQYLPVAPKEFQELAQLIHEKADLTLKFPSSSAEEKVILLKSLDYLRRPERLALFLETCQLINPHSPIQAIEEAVVKLKILNREAIAAQSKTPKDIAMAIFTAECEALR